MKNRLFFVPVLTLFTFYLSLFTLSCGGSGTSSSNTSIANLPPAAAILVNQVEVTEGTELVLDGTRSFDPEGSALTYRWYECDDYLSWLNQMGYTDDSSPYYFDCGGNAQTGLLDLIPTGAGPAPELGVYAENPTQAVLFPTDGEYTYILVVNDGRLDSPPDTVTINVNPAPSPSSPIAVAAADLTGGAPGTRIIVNGSKSKATAAGRAISEYQWYENTNNPQTNLIHKLPGLPYASGVTQAVWPNIVGTYRFTLIVIDTGGAYSSPNNNDEIQVVIHAQNHAPAASAGIGQTVKRNDLVTLTGAGSSDPDNDTLHYSWFLSSRPSVSSASLSNPTTQQPSFTPDVSGNYFATLVVDDGELSSPPASVKIRCNYPPYPNAGTDQAVSIGELVILDGSGSFDSDLDPITYAWNLYSRPAGSVAALNSLIVIWPTFVPDREGNYVFRLALNDGLENSDYPAWITVTTINRRPVAVAKASPNPASLANTVQLNGSSSSDPEGYPVKWAWTLRSRPAGSSAMIIYPNAVTPTFVADRVGDFLVRLVVNDGFIDSYADWVTVTATNLRPKAVAKASPDQLQLSQNTVLNGSQSYDPDGNIISYSWQQIQPSSPSVNIKYPNTVTAVAGFKSVGTYVFKLTVTDNGLPAGLTYSDWVTVTVTNLQPKAVAVVNPVKINIGQNTNLYGNNSYDPDGTISNYLWERISGSDPNPKYSTSITTIVGTFNTSGNHEYKLTVTDNGGLTYHDHVTLTVVNQPPRAIAKANPVDPTNKLSTTTLIGEDSYDPEGYQITYLWDQHPDNPSYPNGVTINSPTQPNSTTTLFYQPGKYIFKLIVTDYYEAITSCDWVTVEVQIPGGAFNNRPTAVAKANGQDPANVGFYDEVTLSGQSSSDSDGSVVDYFWHQISGLPVNLEMTEWPKAVTFIAPDELGTLVFSLVVSDNAYAISYPDYVTVSVWRNVRGTEPAGIFVSKRMKDDPVWGATFNSGCPWWGGSVTAPCVKIMDAIGKFPDNVTDDVYVGTWTAWGKYSDAATGTYQENVVLYDSAAKRGVSIFGGFFEDGTGDWWRNLDSYPTAVTITTVTEVFQTGVVSCDLTSPGILIMNSTYIDGFKIKCNPAGAVLHYGILCDSSMVTIRNNTIYGNNGNGTDNWGIYVYDSNSGAGSPTIVNNYINGGTAGGGPPNQTYGIYFNRSGIDSLVAHNLIFAGNPNPGNSYAIVVQSQSSSIMPPLPGLPSTPIIINNIINGGSGSTGQYGIYENGAYADPKIYNNDILLNGGAATMCLYYDSDGGVCRSTIDSVNSMINSGNNISVNPKFEYMDWGDPLGKHLRKESQCIDAGTDAGIRADKGGNKRPVDVRLPDGTDVDNNPTDAERNIFDIGPYEYPNAVSQ